MAYLFCVACGSAEERYYANRAHSNLCWDCYSQHAKEQRRAVNAVNFAVKTGALPRAWSCVCADCGKAATEYDHRDYTKPLEVEPVCRSCNHKRGSAFNSFYRPESESSPRPSGDQP